MGVQAAVPAYLGQDFSSAPPGHRFSLYLKMWEQDTFKKPKDMNLDVAGRLDGRYINLLNALVARQRETTEFLELTQQVCSFEAKSTSPFSTGLGNEHATENGFAFLNPYGLPYLPGSGVKGVLRAAATELADEVFGESFGWTHEAIAILFGDEGSEHEPGRRGALSFWDVYPRLAGNTMSVEVMTPHQSHYYQQGEAPHDSGRPVPLTFLSVPAGSQFAFFVQTHKRLMLPEFYETSEALLQAAFEHAFTWLGFGAKTAVGYGAMGVDQKAQQERVERQQRRETMRLLAEEETLRQQQLMQMSPVQRRVEEFLDGRKDKNQAPARALLAGLESGEFEAVEIEVAQHIKQLMQADNKWKEQSSKKKPEKDQSYQDTLKVLKWIKNDD